MADNSTTAPRWRARFWRIAPILIIIIYTGVAYSPALQNLLFRSDDLAQVEVFRRYGPLAGFGGAGYDSLYLAGTYYRPFFTVQTSVLYALFGLNYAPYQAAMLILHTLTAIVLYLACFRLTENRLIALLVSLCFAAHPYVSPLVLWVSDSGVLGMLATASVILLLATGGSGPGRTIALGLIMLLLPFMRENALATVLAVMAYAAAVYVMDRASRRDARIVFATGLISLAFYFLIRIMVIGGLFKSVLPESAGFFFAELSPDQVAALSMPRRLALYGYTILANLTGLFFPIIDESGALLDYHLYHAIVVAGAGAFASLMLLNWRRWSARQRRYVLAAVFAAALLFAFLFMSGPGQALLATLGAALSSLSPVAGRVFSAARSFVTQLFIHARKGPRTTLRVDPTVLLTVLIALAVSAWPRWDVKHRAFAVLAAGLILFSSGIAFSYFRVRNLHLAVVGWALLMALSFANLRRLDGGRVFQVAAMLLLVTALSWNAVTLYRRLPLAHLRPDRFTTTSELCASELPDELVAEVLDRSGIPPALIDACLADGR